MSKFVIASFALASDVLADPALRGAVVPETAVHAADQTVPTEDMWVHAGHTGASWGGPWRGGHVGHTGVTYHRPGHGYHHVGHTGASWGGPFRGGHVGHTGATWGHPWMLAETVDPKAVGEVKAEGTGSPTDNNLPEMDNSTDGFWAHVGHTGARWGRGPFGGSYGHVGHTGATWGRRWLLEEEPTTTDKDGVKQATVEPENSIPDLSEFDENSFWMHVGHTGARWGRGWGGGSYGHVGHTGATWGRHWLLDADDTTAPQDAKTEENKTEAFVPQTGQEFWLHIGPTGAAMGLGGVHVGHVGAIYGSPQLEEKFDEPDATTQNKNDETAANTETATAEDSAPTFNEFWAHVGHTGATVGMGGVHVGHTGATWGRPYR